MLSEMSQAMGAQGGSATGKLVVAVGTSVGFLGRLVSTLGPYE